MTDAPEVERSREFIPNDIIEPSLSEREQQLDDRIEELRKKRESFDPETQFVGIRRLGSSYTVAEPYAFFDGPSDYQLRYSRATYAGLAAMTTVAATIIAHKIRGYPYIVGLLRGMVLGVPGGFCGYWIHDWRLRVGRIKQNVLFSYALIHEQDFPKIERKKYDEIIKDFTAHRSLNGPELGWKW